ncbi:hypothetical protein I6E29_02540 [Arcanobacterium haemolyticum]|nr:hypothetical protein [Arcanobacterium haemolyticum]
MIWLVAICGVMLAVSALLVLYRIEKGPSTIDRVVSVDVMTSILLGALALLAALTRRSDLLAVFVVVSVIGFLGSVAIARAAKREDPGNRRILTLEEERAAREAEEAAEEESEEVVVHDVDAAETPSESPNSALWYEPGIPAYSGENVPVTTPPSAIPGEDAPNEEPRRSGNDESRSGHQTGTQEAQR